MNKNLIKIKRERERERERERVVPSLLSFIENL